MLLWLGPAVPFTPTLQTISRPFALPASGRRFMCLRWPKLSREQTDRIQARDRGSGPPQTPSHVGKLCRQPLFRSEVARIARAHACVEGSREEGEMQEQFSQSDNPAERLLQTRRRRLPKQRATHGCCEQYQ